MDWIVVFVLNNSTLKIIALGTRDAALVVESDLSNLNIFSSLEGSSLPRLKFLQELRLYDNKLRDLQGILKVLSRLSRLRDLDIFGNAVVEEENYRLHVIRAIPSLDILDRHVITIEERTKAARYVKYETFYLKWQSHPLITDLKLKMELFITARSATESLP